MGRQGSDLRGGYAKRRNRLGDDVRAVNEFSRVLTEDGEFGHGGLEVAHHQLLVVDHALPLASSSLFETRQQTARREIKAQKGNEPGHAQERNRTGDAFHRTPGSAS